MKLNHDAKSMAGALGISEERHRYIHSLVWWSFIHQYHMKKNLYEKDDDDIPGELCKRSGVLEYILNDLSTEAERLLAVYDFQKIDTLTDENENAKMTFSALFLKAEMLDWDKDAFIKFFSGQMLEASEPSEA